MWDSLPQQTRISVRESAHVRVHRFHHFRCVCAVPLHGRQDVRHRKCPARVCDWLLHHGEHPRAGEETQEETSVLCVNKFQ